MSAHDRIDGDTARKFLELFHSRAADALSHVRRPGVLQLVSMSPNARPRTSQYRIGDVDHMVKDAQTEAEAGKNVFVEIRTTRADKFENGRGKAEATIGVFAIVCDLDNDRKGKGGAVVGNPSVVIETSPGNFQAWYFLRHAIGPTDLAELRECIMAAGGDDCACVPTQPFRVPGFMNLPTKKKVAAGRTPVMSKIVSVTERVFTPGELKELFLNGAADVSIPPDLAIPTFLQRRKTLGTSRRKAIAKAKIAKPVDSETDRSAAFQSCVNSADRAGMTADEIEHEMREHPNGPQQKYLEGTDRLRSEIDRSVAKVKQQRPEEQAQRDAEHAERVAAGKGIDGAALLDRVYEFIGRFVVYPDRHAQVAHVLWAAHCHLIGCFETTPRLAFLSPELGSGKTRGLEITELLVPNPVLAVNVSPAYLVRRIGLEGGVTVLFDEVDTVFGPRAKDANEDVRSLLNSGYRRGAVVGRCVMQGSVAITEELPSFAPVALAGLGRLPDTVLSRSVVIRMQRRAPDEPITPCRRRNHAGEGQRLCGQLASWAAVVASRITVPNMPAEIVDRDADCWEALLAVAEAAGGHWPDTARCCAVALVLALREEGEERLGLRLLADMRTVLGDDEQAATTTILDKLHALDESPWADIHGKPLNDRGLATRLRPYRIKPRTIRVGEATPRGYRRADFVNAWKRYLPPPSSG